MNDNGISEAHRRNLLADAYELEQIALGLERRAVSIRNAARTMRDAAEVVGRYGLNITTPVVPQEGDTQ